MDMTRRKNIPANTTFEDLLVPIFRDGKCVYQKPSINEIKARTKQQLSHFYTGVKRFVNPHSYPVGLEISLFDEKMALILKLRERNK